MNRTHGLAALLMIVIAPQAAPPATIGPTAAEYAPTAPATGSPSGRLPGSHWFPTGACAAQCAGRALPQLFLAGRGRRHRGRFREGVHGQGPDEGC